MVASVFTDVKMWVFGIIWEGMTHFSIRHSSPEGVGHFVASHKSKESNIHVLT